MQPKPDLHSQPRRDSINHLGAYLRVGKVMAYSEYNEVCSPSINDGIFHVVITCNRSDGAQHLLYHVLRSSRKNSSESCRESFTGF